MAAIKISEETRERERKMTMAHIKLGRRQARGKRQVDGNGAGEERIDLLQIFGQGGIF